MSSKLYELLQGVIQKVNKSVSTDAQQLTDEQKLQVKTNLGISDTTASAIPDWNQNDETAPDYIKNRTHWKDDEIHEILPTTTVTADNRELHLNGDFSFKDGDVIAFIIDNVKYEVELRELKVGEYYSASLVSETIYAMFNANDPMGDVYRLSLFFQGTYFDTNSNVSVRVLKIDRTYHVLEEDYIPSSIARASELQNDWTINDTTNNRYIRNRPFYHKEEENTVIYNGTLSPTTDEQSISITELEYNGHYSVQIGKEWSYSALQPQPSAFIMGSYIGNLSLGYSDGENTGETFLIVEEKGYDNLRVWLSNDVISEYSSEAYPPNITLSLCTPEELKKLDEKFLPDTIARVSDIPGACITDSELTTLADLLGVTLEGETNTTQE